MNRRRFAFWVGMALFWVSDRLRASAIDSVAATMMDRAEKNKHKLPPHTKWTSKESKTWRWFERHKLVHDKWKLTGRTTPVHKETGEPYKGKTGYLSEELVPDSVKRIARRKEKLAEHKADPERKARDGRPPSEWLRRLNADELRLWMTTIEVPEVGVSGMTFFTHLTRDHSFDAKRIEGLSNAELAKLHSAAHFGY